MLLSPSSGPGPVSTFLMDASAWNTVLSVLCCGAGAGAGLWQPGFLVRALAGLLM